MIITPMLPQHADAIMEIYRQGILSGVATFETEAPGWKNFDERFLSHSRLVAVENDQVMGWAVIAPVSSRECYKGVAEVTIYVHDQHQGRGIGKALLNALVDESEKNGIWSLLSVIHEENRASIHLHEQCGFRFIGYRERIAQLHGVWKTTVMMERRSRKVGV